MSLIYKYDRWLAKRRPFPFLGGKMYYVSRKEDDDGNLIIKFTYNSNPDANNYIAGFSSPAAAFIFAKSIKYNWKNSTLVLFYLGEISNNKEDFILVSQDELEVWVDFEEQKLQRELAE